MTGVYSALFCKYSIYSGNILHSNSVDFKKEIKVNNTFFLVRIFYSKKAAINSATQAGFSCPLISTTQEKVTLKPLLEISSI